MAEAEEIETIPHLLRATARILDGRGHSETVELGRKRGPLPLWAAMKMALGYATTTPILLFPVAHRRLMLGAHSAVHMYLGGLLADWLHAEQTVTTTVVALLVDTANSLDPEQ